MAQFRDYSRGEWQIERFPQEVSPILMIALLGGVAMIIVLALWDDSEFRDKAGRDEFF